MDRSKPLTNGRSPDALREPCLIVIDMQRYFLEKGCDAFLEHGPAIIPNVRRLIESFRVAGMPVVFTRHGHLRDAPRGSMHAWWKGDLLYTDDPQADIAAELAPMENEIVEKEHYSAFVKTALEEILSRHSVKDVVVCGVMTHLCVESTARDAFMRDFQPVIAMDACATISEEMHVGSLKNMAHGFAHVVKTDGIIQLL